MPEKERINYLLSLYVSGALSAEQHDELFELISTHQYDDLLGEHILQDLKEGDISQGADLPPHIAQEIIRNIYAAERISTGLLPSATRRFIGWKWMAAASVLFLVILVPLFLVFNQKSDKDSFVSLIPNNTIVQTNPTAHPKAISLADGSVITLAPHSTIHFPKQFSGDKREVYLEGEAFFQVTKKPKQPFLVYYNDIVTKVLGTSFTINTNSKTGNIEVSVRTGRVQVYENEKLSEDKRPDVAVIVTPNQKAIYKKESRLFETTLIDEPQAITDESGNRDSAASKYPHFVFDQEKLQDVFKQIENSYGIEILVENTAINDCVFTGDVFANDLYAKLNIICLTINASYEINGTRILIKGKGCN